MTLPELSAEPICDSRFLNDVAELLDVLSEVLSEALDVLLDEELLVVLSSRLVSES